jgi:hypothetical protein
MLASLPRPTRAEDNARDRAEHAARMTLYRVAAHVANDSAELRHKAEYLSARLAMGDVLEPDMLAALLLSTARFNSPHHA